MKALLFSALLMVVSMPGLSVAAGAGDSAKIDDLLSRFWKEKGVTPNPVADDETFVRRIYLDIAGRIPTAAETRQFLSESSENKRADLIDVLLDSEGYVNHYFNYWADILRINSQQGGGENIVPEYVEYVKTALRENKPYDEFVYDLITADGGGDDIGATGYYYRDRGMPLDNMANTVRIFLGTRLECAQCHNHPFDEWTQMDFYHMAAFSYGVETRDRYQGMLRSVQQMIQRDENIPPKQKNDLRRAFQEIGRPLRNNPDISYNGKKLPQLPHDYQYDDAKPKEIIAPRTMFGEEIEAGGQGSRLSEYARWLTSKENPRFTTVIANRLWKRAFGLGLIEPVDEFMVGTEAVSPDLVTCLEEQMMAKNYDIKAFLRMVFNTRAYQREAAPDDLENPADFAFTGPLLRRMSAEQIWDSLVTLINPAPDEGNWILEKELELREAAFSMLSEALEAKSGEELLADARRIAQTQKSQQAELAELQKQQAKAREEKDQEKIRNLSRETNRIRGALRDEIFKTVYQPAMAQTSVEVASLDLPAGQGTMEMTPSMVDANGRPTRQVRRQLEKAGQVLIEREMDEMGITDEKERRAYLNFRRGTASNYARAANLPSPAPDGHFLRQFGQSDRETIQNADEAASVPQALTMLNGPLLQTIVNPQSVLSRSVAECETPQQKLDVAFLSLLNRKPEPAERDLILSDLEQRGGKLYEDVVFALLNSQEFIFVK